MTVKLYPKWKDTHTKKAKDFIKKEKNIVVTDLCEFIKWLHEI